MTTLLFLSLLIVMVGALFSAVKSKLFLSQNYRNQVAALYLAELAVNDAMTELENDPDWVAGFSDKTLPGVDGSYSLTFNTSGPPFGEFESVNNATGSGDESYHGPGTVDRGHCLLVATAQVGRSTRTVEALVEVGGGLPPLDVPLLNDGKIVLRGDVDIQGVKSLRDNSPVLAGIHSNLATSAPNLVDLSAVTSASTITGEISSSGSSTNALSLGAYGARHTGGQATGASPKPFPHVDIISQVAAKSSAPAPLIGGGTTVLSVSAAPEYYHSGALTINGDLKLQGVSLYVDGPLTINGALEGNGSVYVTGKSTFQGSTSVTTTTPDKVALFSHGSVQVSGFDGSQYMGSVGASSPIFRLLTVDLNRHLFNLRNELADSALPWGPGSVVDVTRERIGWSVGSSHSGPRPGQDILHNLASLAAREPASSARDSTVQKLRELEELFVGVSVGTPEENFAVDQARAGRFSSYSVDTLIDKNLTEYRQDLLALLSGLSLNRPGEAFFQGLVYTHGFVHASQEVTIVGAVAATKSGAGPIAPSELIDGDTLNPGDVYLLDGSRLLYVEDFFLGRQPTAAPAQIGARLVLWMGR